MKRIFIGLGFSVNLQKEILNWGVLWRGKLSEQTRWLKGANLHITLIPPWYAMEDGIKEITEKVKKAAEGIKPFTVKFNKITYGTDQKRPRLIWAIGRSPAALISLNKKLKESFNQKDNYNPSFLHCTLARFRPELFSQFRMKQLEEKVFWRDRIESVVVFEAKLSPRGAEYFRLAEIKLS